MNVTSLMARLARLEDARPPSEGGMMIVRFVDVGPDGGPVSQELRALKALGGELSFLRGPDETEGGFVERVKSLLPSHGSGLRVLMEAQ